MNSGLSHGNGRAMSAVIDRIRKAGPRPRFTHLGNNGVWCDRINEMLAVKRARTLYISPIVSAWGGGRDGGPAALALPPGVRRGLHTAARPLASPLRKPGSPDRRQPPLGAAPAGLCVPGSHRFACTRPTSQWLDLSWWPLPSPGLRGGIGHGSSVGLMLTVNLGEDSGACPLPLGIRLSSQELGWS